MLIFMLRSLADSVLLSDMYVRETVATSSIGDDEEEASLKVKMFVADGATFTVTSSGAVTSHIKLLEAKTGLLLEFFHATFMSSP